MLNIPVPAIHKSLQTYGHFAYKHSFNSRSDLLLFLANTAKILTVGQITPASLGNLSFCRGISTLVLFPILLLLLAQPPLPSPIIRSNSVPEDTLVLLKSVARDSAKGELHYYSSHPLPKTTKAPNPLPPMHFSRKQWLRSIIFSLSRFLRDDEFNFRN
ncbi:hypothetical protein CEXT_491601 [Caerostris extrusa]|uniref:Uncharacterized protein n=1 Tax=Caerostris extrusa TaxID=172846 RepID=A0AAV4U2R2_CAEEX|nr:hypothetical protein CEXT_491601 [Caerostris extrusa]